MAFRFLQLFDRRGLVRRSRSSARRRRLRRWIWLVLASLAAFALIAWWMADREPATAPGSRIVSIGAAADDRLSLDGTPVSIGELERQLRDMQTVTPYTSAILEPALSRDESVTDMLGRLNMSWLSIAHTPQSGLREGDHVQ